MREYQGYQVRFNCTDSLYGKIKQAAADKKVSMSAFVKSLIVPEVPKDMKIPEVQELAVTKNIPIWLSKDEYNFIKYQAVKETRSMSNTVIELLKKVKPSLFK